MSKDQSNPLIDSGKPLFFKVANADVLGFEMPAIRSGEAVRLSVRSLSVMQKEALVASASTGNVWRLASDEGAYLAGLDEAPCPLSFLSTASLCQIVPREESQNHHYQVQSSVFPHIE